MKKGNKVTAYKYNKNDELLRTDTLNTGTEEDSIVIYKNDKNGNQLAMVNRYEIPSEKKNDTYVDIDVTLGDNRLNENVVNHYNALNQLTQTLTKNYKVSFTYDAEGLRTSKTVNGKKTVFVWDGDQLVLELSESGKVQKRYVRGNDLVYADKGTGTEKQFYVTDSHGNVVQLTDENGKVTKTYEYDSFGNEVKPDSKDDNPFRYCGEYYDKETEEIYLRARYYQPVVGRFLTRDTYMGEEDDVLSLHLYAYCGYDGVNMVDSSGHIPTPMEAAYMCENVYRQKGSLIGGWKKRRYIPIPESNGVIGVYYRKRKGHREYCLANKGTEPRSLSDWINNAQQLFGYSGDMKYSIREAKKFVNKHTKNEITFVGHSKGGAEAAANAVKTNKNCIIFNPATVNLSAYGISSSGYTSDMVAYIVKGDILHSVENAFSKPIGRIVYLPRQYGHDLELHTEMILVNGIRNHLMGAVKNALNEKKGSSGGARF